MNEKLIKVMIALFVGFGVVVTCVGIMSDDNGDTYNVVAENFAADGLDLRAVGALLKDAKDAESFEKLINDQATGVNNLDLNEDGKVDYISVTEFGKDDVRGFSLTTELEKGEVQEVATISIEKAADGSARVQTEGNSNIYGQNHYYHSSWSPGFGTGLMMGYLFAPHSFYRSPYGYGHYPSHYGSYSSVPSSSYKSRVDSRTAGSQFSKGRHQNGKMLGAVRSPNSGKSSARVKAPLRNPTAAQKSFQAKNPSKSRSGGFGRSSSVRSSSRSGGSFGGK